MDQCLALGFLDALIELFDLALDVLQLFLLCFPALFHIRHLALPVIKDDGLRECDDTGLGFQLQQESQKLVLHRLS